MAQMVKVKAKTEIKCPHAKVYDFLRYKMTEFTQMLPNIFTKSQLLEGEEGQQGNVKLFEYVLGKAMTMKVKTEIANDDAIKKCITFVVVEGEVLETYEYFQAKVTISEGLVEWCIECEKANDSIPNPDKHAKLTIEITKGIDTYLLNC